MKKILLILFTITATAGLTLALTETESNTNRKSDVTETIRLYSDGKLIDEWEGIGKGRLEGNTYTFTVSRGAFRETVRINGDFVVFRKPN